MKSLSPDCKHCASLLEVMGAPSLARYGAVQEGVDTVPDIIFEVGKPSKPATLVLPKATVAYGRGVYTGPPLCAT